MFQSFDVSTNPNDGPPRLEELRKLMRQRKIDGFVIPRADAHQGEYVAARDERLSWLTGFTGSAGFCAVLLDQAGVFIDGRYTVQVREQVDLKHFTPVDFPANQLASWLADRMQPDQVLAFDPWLHTEAELEKLRSSLSSAGVALLASDNLIDAIWDDQPAAPLGNIIAQPLEFAGKTSLEKRTEIVESLNADATVITLPDSIAWLLNVRGSDIVRNPIPHAFAILRKSGDLDLFCAPEKISEELKATLDEGISFHDVSTFASKLEALTGTVQLDKASAPVALQGHLAGAVISWGADCCALPKASKNAAEISGMRDAHLRDAVAMCKFLAWIDTEAPKGNLTEIDAATQLETFRRADNGLRDISFETISAAGPHAALPHYRVNTASNRSINPGELYLVDSGGQYLNGTTDITRTVAIGEVGDEEKRCYTRVLQGMIAVSRARWPRGLAGRDLDPLARYPLWLDGRDYDHGTGHGVGAYLCVHEGPQRLSRISHVPFKEGMILSNEPGYYKEGAFGIRIENLIVVQQAPAVSGQDARDMLSFENLTWVPIDIRPLKVNLLSVDEIDWINSYHAEVRTKIADRLDAATAEWLEKVTAPLT